MSDIMPITGISIGASAENATVQPRMADSGEVASSSPFAADGETELPPLAQLVSENAELGAAILKFADDFEKQAEPAVDAATRDDVENAAPTVAAAPAVSPQVPQAAAEIPSLPELVTENAKIGAALAEQTSAFQPVVDAATRSHVEYDAEEGASSPLQAAPVVASAVPESPRPAAQAGLPPLSELVTANADLGATIAEQADALQSVVDAATRGFVGDGADVVSDRRGEDAAPVGAGTAHVATAMPEASRAVAETTAVSAPAEVSPASLVQAADAVADEILVSSELMLGKGEIRVQLKPDVLGGSAVTVSVTGRQLDVTFVPATQEIAVLVAQNQAAIAAHLAARIRTFNVSLDVRRTSSYGSEERA